jgi:hypothetical protein
MVGESPFMSNRDLAAGVFRAWGLMWGGVQAGGQQPGS